MSEKTQEEKDKAMSGNAITNLFKNPNREKVKKVIKKRQNQKKKKQVNNVSSKLGLYK